MTEKNNEADSNRRERGQRALTDEDVKKIVDCLEKRLEQSFYINLGKGVWSFLWRAIAIGLLTLAAYGQYKS